MRFNLHRALMVAGGTLAVAGLMAAYSYTTASVTNAATLSVVDTNQALLALTPGTPAVGGYPDKDVPASIQNGNLVFDFNKGLGGADFGLQQNSTYYWDGMFTIQNNSSNAVQVTITDANLPAGVTLSMNQGETGKGATTINTNDASGLVKIQGNTGLTFTIPAGGWQEMDVQAQVGAMGISNSSNMTINVNAAAVGGDL